MIEFKMLGKLMSKNKARQVHWNQLQDEHDKWKRKTYYAFHEQCDPEQVPPPPWLLKVTGYVPDKRIRDTINWASHSLAGIQDALSEGNAKNEGTMYNLGLVEDDNWRFIRDVWVSYGRADEKSHVGVKIFNYRGAVDYLRKLEEEL